MSQCKHECPEHPRLDRSAFEREHAHSMCHARIARARMYWHIVWAVLVWAPIMVYLITRGSPFPGFWALELVFACAQYGGAWAIGRYTR